VTPELDESAEISTTYFVSRPDDREIALLETVLDSVVVDCTFG
jgi:hypothetical protein